MAATYQHLIAGLSVLGANYGFDQPDNQEGVLGYGYGWIRRDDVWTGDLGMVLLVARDRPGFPYSYVRVDGDDGPADVPCCAFVLDRYRIPSAPAIATEESPRLSVGAPLSPRPGLAIGTSAYVLGSDGRYLVTAAHVLDVDPNSDRVYCGRRLAGSRLALNPAGRRFFDLAFVKVAEALRGPDLQSRADGVVVGAMAPLTWEDLNDRASVFQPTRSAVARPWILAAGMTLHLLGGTAATRTQTAMIMTEACTQPGDSGTGLVSAAGRTLGVLSHGRREFSFFTSLADAQRAGFWPEEDS